MFAEVKVKILKTNHENFDKYTCTCENKTISFTTNSRLLLQRI